LTAVPNLIGDLAVNLAQVWFLRRADCGIVAVRAGFTASGTSSILSYRCSWRADCRHRRAVRHAADHDCTCTDSGAGPDADSGHDGCTNADKRIFAAGDAAMK
jgi:hypothetical protein